MRLYDVIWAEVLEGELELSYLDRRAKGKSVLASVRGQVSKAEEESAEEWCDSVMRAAYDGASIYSVPVDFAHVQRVGQASSGDAGYAS